nr:hypothetical protein Q903MT_gene5310 [Picea sitchensis]
MDGEQLMLIEPMLHVFVEMPRGYSLNASTCMLPYR